MKRMRVGHSVEVVRTGFLLAVIVAVVLGLTALANGDVITGDNSAAPAGNGAGATTGDVGISYDGSDYGGGWEADQIANPDDFDGVGGDSPTNVNAFVADDTGPADLGSLQANMSGGTPQDLIYVQGISVVDRSDDATAAIQIDAGSSYGFAWSDENDNDTYDSGTDNLYSGTGIRIEGSAGVAGAVSSFGGVNTNPAISLNTANSFVHLVADETAGDAGVIGTITDAADAANVLIMDIAGAATASVTGAVNLGNGDDTVLVRGDGATSQANFTSDGTAGGTVQTITGGSGNNEMIFADATVFGNIDLATTGGGDDEIEFDGADLTGNVVMGNSNINQVDLAGGMTLTGDVTFGTATTSNGMRIEDAGNTLDGNLILGDDLSILPDGDPGTHTLSITGEIRMAAGTKLALNEGEVLTGGTITDADGGTGAVDATLEILAGTLDAGSVDLTTQTGLALKFSSGGATVANLSGDATFASLLSTNPADGVLNANNQNVTLDGSNGNNSNFTGTLTNVADLDITGGAHTFGGGWSFGEASNDAAGFTVDSGGNTIQLQGNNNITGDVIVSGGTLQLTGDNTFGENTTDSRGMYVASGATAELTGNNTVTGDIQVAGTLTAVTSGVGGATLVIDNGATIAADAGGPLVASVDLSNITSTNGFTIDPTNNDVTVSVGTGFGNLGAGGTASIDITDGAGNTATIAALTSDASSDETFTLGTNGDAVTIDSPALHGDDTLQVADGVTATFSGGDWSSGTLTGVADGGNGGGTLTINSGIAGGTVNINASGTVAGDISGGTVNVAGSADISGTVSGGTVNNDGTLDISGTLTGGTVNVNEDATISGAFNGGSIVVDSGKGLSLSGTADGTGTVDLSGTLQAATANLGSSTVTVRDGATIQASTGALAASVDTSNLVGGESFTADTTNDNVTLTGVSIDAGGGTVTINTAGGNTTILDGFTTAGSGDTLALGGAMNLTATGTLASGDTLDFAGQTLSAQVGSTLDLAGTVTGGTLDVAGTANITGTFSGGSIIANGSVYVSDAGMSGGTVDVRDGGTIGSADATALTLDASAAELDMSNLADTHAFTVDAQNADVTIASWALPAASGVTIATVNSDTNTVTLQDLSSQSGGVETLTVGTGADSSKVFLTGTVTLTDGGDIVSAAAGATIVLDGATAGLGAVQAGAGTLLYGSNATLPATIAGDDGIDVTAGDATFATDVDLSGAHSFDGGNTATFSGDVDFAGNAITMTVATGTEVVLDGTVSDMGATGSLTQDGPGTLTIQTAVPTDVTASDGTLALGTGGSVDGNLDASGGSADVTLASGTTVDGDLSVGAGTLTLGDDGITGDVTLAESTVDPQANVTLDDNLTLDTGVTVTGGNTLTSTGDLTLSNPVGITTDAGTKLDLNNSASAGAHKITKDGAGTLAINGTGAPGEVEVTAGTLMGTGPIGGTLTIGSGGTHSPGNSIGEQNVTGDYDLNDGATLQIEIAKGATPENDKIIATGAANLGDNATIQVISATGSLQQDDEFTIIETGTGVNLAGDGPTVESLVGWDFSGGIDADNTDNYILTATSRPFVDLATNGNERSIGAALDAMGSNTLVTELRNLPDAQYSAGIRQVDPAPHTAPGLTTMPGINQANGNIAGRLSALRQGSADLARSGSSPLGLAVATVADDPTRMAAVVEAMEQAQGGPGVGRADRGRKGSFLTWRPFAKVYGTFVDQDTTTEQTGFSSNGVGMITGVDTDVNEWLTAGVMFGYNHDEIDYDLSRGEADVDSLRFGPYASASFGDLFVDASLTFGYHWNEVDRKVTVGAFRETAKSDYDAWDLTLYGGVGYDIDLEGWIVTPTASLQWTHYDQESFRESGAGAANLDVDSWQSDTIRQVLGVKLRKMFHCDGLRIVPEAYLGWAHEYIDQDNVTANFVGQNTPFSFSVDTGDSDALIFGAGTSVLLNETTSVYVRWDGQCGSETTANNVAVGMSFSF